MKTIGHTLCFKVLSSKILVCHKSSGTEKFMKHGRAQGAINCSRANRALAPEAALDYIAIETRNSWVTGDAIQLCSSVSASHETCMSDNFTIECGPESPEVNLHNIFFTLGGRPD